MFVDDKPKKKTNSPKPSVATEENLNVIYSAVELPSKGKLSYPSEIHYRDILVRDEKEIASATEKTFVKVLNSVLKNLLKEQDEFEKLTIYDRDFLLLWIWANSYSTVKTVEVTCPSCGHKNRYDIDLTKLEVKDLSEDYVHPYKMTLPSGKEVTLKLITVGDEELVRKFCAANTDVDETFALLCNSVSFGVVTSLRDKIAAMDNFSGKDMSAIRGFHNKFKYGVNDKVSKECNSCGEVSEFSVPFQVDFFLPVL